MQLLVISISGYEDYHIPNLSVDLTTGADTVLHTLMLVLTLALTSQNAQAGDIPWFNRAAAESLVLQSEPDWLAHLQDRYRDDPAEYANHLHKALAMVAKKDDIPEIYAAWSRVCAAELAYRQAVAAYRAAPDSAKPAFQPTLVTLATAWESAIAELYAAKIPQAEERLFHLEANLTDLQANFDAFVMDRVLNTTAQ